jgi:hypothetical protein
MAVCEINAFSYIHTGKKWVEQGFLFLALKIKVIQLVMPCVTSNYMPFSKQSQIKIQKKVDV